MQRRRFLQLASAGLAASAFPRVAVAKETPYWLSLHTLKGAPKGRLDGAAMVAALDERFFLVARGPAKTKLPFRLRAWAYDFAGGMKLTPLAKAESPVKELSVGDSGGWFATGDLKEFAAIDPDAGAKAVGATVGGGGFFVGDAEGGLFVGATRGDGIFSKAGTNRWSQTHSFRDASAWPNFRGLAKDPGAAPANFPVGPGTLWPSQNSWPSQNTWPSDSTIVEGIRHMPATEHTRLLMLAAVPTDEKLAAQTTVGATVLLYEHG